MHQPLWLPGNKDSKAFVIINPVIEATLNIETNFKQILNKFLVIIATVAKRKVVILKNWNVSDVCIYAWFIYSQIKYWSLCLQFFFFLPNDNP